MSIWNHEYNFIDFQAIWKIIFMIADSHISKINFLEYLTFRIQKRNTSVIYHN
mgnify:FL=1